jgi:hypothetical protein
LSLPMKSEIIHLMAQSLLSSIIEQPPLKHAPSDSVSEAALTA